MNFICYGSKVSCHDRSRVQNYFQIKLNSLKKREWSSKLKISYFQRKEKVGDKGLKFKRQFSIKNDIDKRKRDCRIFLILK